jgi:hypothetical protein
LLGLAPPETPGKAGRVATGFSGNPRVPANTGFSFNVAPDSKALNVVFDNLYQDVPAATKGPARILGLTASQTKAFTLKVPYATDEKSVRIAMDLRGCASADGVSCVKFIAHAGDTTQGIDVLEASGDKAGAPVKLKDKAKETVLATTDRPKGKATDYVKRLEFTLQTNAAKPVCQITLILLAEHDTDTPDAGGAVVMVDSLDLSFTTTGQGQFRH